MIEDGTPPVGGGALPVGGGASPVGGATLAGPDGTPASGGAAQPAGAGRIAGPRREGGVPTWLFSRLGRPLVVDWLRRGLAVLIAVGAVVAVASGTADVCADTLTQTGTVVRTCRSPQVGDGLVVASLVVLLLLLLPDLAEVGVPGLFTLRRRVEEQESRLETEEARRSLLESQVVNLTARLSSTSSARAVGVDALNIFVSGDETADYAAAERPVSVLRHGGVPPPAGSDPAPAGPVVVDRVSRARYTAADLFVRRMRAHPGGGLEGATLHLYLPDETGMALVPVFETDRADRATDWWQVGQGLVGRAWRDREVLTARGPDVLADLAGLPPERRERYRSLAAVAAVPVLNGSGRPIAVLAGSSEDPATRLDGPEGVETLLTNADAVARVLVDLLGWETDA